MKPATAVAAVVAGIGCLLVLTAGPRLLLYWALVVPSLLLLHGLWVLAIAAAIAVIVFAVNVARSGCRRGRLSAPLPSIIAEEETT